MGLIEEVCADKVRHAARDWDYDITYNYVCRNPHSKVYYMLSMLAIHVNL